MAIRSSRAVWQGGLKDGEGVMRIGGEGYEGKYTFVSRFEEGSGTNPEELVGAAHAGCFSMAFSAELEKGGYSPKEVKTTAHVYLEMVEGRPTITRIHLESEAEVPGIDERSFQEKAEAAKTGCPISRLLSAAEITLEARLVG